jgi:uncharacterized protein YkwD
VHGWPDPDEPARPYPGRGHFPDPAPGDTWSPTGRHSAEPPRWPAPARPEQHRHGRQSAKWSADRKPSADRDDTLEPSAEWYDSLKPSNDRYDARKPSTGWYDDARTDTYGFDPDPTATGWYGAPAGPDGYGGYDRSGRSAPPEPAGWHDAEYDTAHVDYVDYRALDVEYPAAHALSEPLDALPDLAEGKRRRLGKHLVLAGIAAGATLLIVLGIAGLLPGARDGEVPATAIGDGTAAATDDPGTEGTDGLPSELLSAVPSASAPTRPATSAPAPRAPAPAEPTRAAAPVPTPNRTTSSAPRPSPSTPASPPSSAAPSRSSGPTESEAEQVVALVNEERADAGCRPVAVDSKLTTAAQLHSEDQAEHQNMSHTGSDGSTLEQRVDRVGYKWHMLGENVAYGQTTPAQVMDAWMNSEGHRENIINCQFDDIGVGAARDSDGRLYWTQDFGR